MAIMKYLCLLLFFITSLYGEIRIALVDSIADIDLSRSKTILVTAFMTGYEDVPLSDLNPKFASIGDVRRFYEGYFESELDHFKKGKLVWVQAFDEERLVGWATFELEGSDAAYMNLLVVDPHEQRKGIGKTLTFAINSLYPNINAIHLLIRKVNVEGRKFYERIGFVESDYARDNFVDPALLTGLSWLKNS
jgi:ribosomal protein S18 acetylase RimI-like enzyme